MEENTTLPLIVFDKVEKQYNGITVLSETSFSIKNGEFVTLIGTSGCGKTTLLKLCNGLLLPDNGTVTIAGQDTKKTNLIALRRSIGYVIQTIGLFPHMTVAQNITYVPHLQRRPHRQHDAELAAELLQTVGLNSACAVRYPSELSGGEMQRVGIARALASRPRLMLMDEPFSAVDEITRRHLQQELMQIWRRQNLTVLFITHDIREALKLATRVLVMDQGKIVQDAAPDIIRLHPRTEFVRQLVNDSI